MRDSSITQGALRTLRNAECVIKRDKMDSTQIALKEMASGRILEQNRLAINYARRNSQSHHFDPFPSRYDYLQATSIYLDSKPRNVFHTFFPNFHL